MIALVLLLAARRWPAHAAASVLAVGAAILGALRLVLQAVEAGARVPLGLVTVGVAVAVLTLAVAILAGRPGGGPAAAAAVSVGAAAGVGLQLALGTWDALWRHTTVGWFVTVSIVGCLIWLATLTLRDPATAPTRQVQRLWALGPFLALAAMMLANPAFAASQSGVPLALAGPMNALGLLVAGWLVTCASTRATRGRRQAFHRWHWVHAGLVAMLVGAALGLGGVFRLDGIVVLLALLGAQIAAVSLLANALQPPSGTSGHHIDDLSLSGAMSLRLAGAACLVGTGTIVPLLLYQIDYNIPLGFPNELVLVVTAAILGTAGVSSTTITAVAGAPGARPLRWTLVASSGAVVLVGSMIAGVSWTMNRHSADLAGTQHAAAGSGVVMSWNLHYGVSSAGSVDLETTARTIEAQKPDAVLLQEVSRGWVLGGGVDMATWMSDRLGRQFVFASAADRRFGNVILSRADPQDVTIRHLPYGDGPQNRSAVSARVLVGTQMISVTSVHLQNRDINTPTRLLQIQALLADLGSADTAESADIVGGDFNAVPGSAEIGPMIDAGYVSAIDTVGDTAAATSPADRHAPARARRFCRGAASRAFWRYCWASWISPTPTSGLCARSAQPRCGRPVRVCHRAIRPSCAC